MKLTKNLLETLAGVMATKTTEVSPKGNYVVKGFISEGTMEKMSLAQLKQRHAAHHENGGGSDLSYKAMGAIEAHVGKKYGKKALEDLHKHTEDHALGQGHGIAALKEEEMTPGQKQRREDIVRGMKSNAAEFKKKYGVDWEGVMYATATKRAMNEDVVMEAYKESLAAHELPDHVKDAVKKVHAVLKKHKVQGAHVSVAHHDYEPKHEKASGGHHEINIQVGRHHIDNDDLVSDLHQTQPHKWHHGKGDVAIAPCASIHPSPRHNLHEEVLEESGRYLRRGESGGRHYKDEHGVTWDDEGHNSAGTGPSDRAYHHAPKHKYPPKQKHYHSVPYKDKEHAKGEGMKWDGDKKKWYHTDAAKSATSKFKKLHEEAEELDEAINISARNKRGTMSTLTGKKIGSGNGHEVYAGSVKHDDGQASAPHHVWVMHDGKIKSSIATHDAEEHKKHIEIAKKHLTEEEQLDENAIYVGSRVAKKKLLGGEKYGSATPSSKGEGHHTVKWDDGSTSIEHHSKLKALNSMQKGYWDHKGGPPKHMQGKLKEEALDEETKKKDVKPVPGELNKMALDQHLTKHEKHFMGFDNVRAKEAISDIHKMRSTHPSKLINGIGAHLDHLKGLTGFVQGSNKKPELTEEMIDEMFNRDTGHSEKDSTVKGHLVSVTVSDPNHPAVSKRDEQTEKRIRVKTGAGKDFAMKKAQAHYKKMGLKVHQVNHVKHLYEEENDFVLFAEEFNTREQAEKAMEKHEKKHPLAKHTVMQGRRSGKWHVVRHTSGGMHVIEELEDEAPILEGDESEADFQSYMKAHRAGLDHHTKQDSDIDNDGKKNDPNDKYLRNRRAQIAKNIAKGK